MNLVGPYIKAMLLNRTLWFWGVAFMFFWLVMGAFVFNSGSSFSHAGAVDYTASWYGIIALFSLSTLATTITFSLSYSTSALAYGFRFTRLRPRDYLLSVLAGSGVLGIFLSVIMAVASVGVFSLHFGFALVPANLLALLGISAVAGTFMLVLAMSLMLTVVNYLGLRNTNFVGFLPLLLAYGFGIAQVNVSLPPWLEYASPYTDISSLFYQAFAGSAYPVDLSQAILTGSSASLQWPYLLLSLFVWILVLSAISTVLLRRIRPRSVEEGRRI